MTFHRALQEHVERKHTVDLVGAFKYSVYPRITVGPVHRSFWVESLASIYLLAFVHVELQLFRTMDFHDRAFDRKLFLRFESCLRGVHPSGDQRFIGIIDVLAGAIAGRFRSKYPG